jgi:hypothetical protein
VVLKFFANRPASASLVIALACGIAAISGPALAQNAPVPVTSPSPAPSASPIPKHSLTRAKSSQVGHFPIIDIVPIFTRLAPYNTAAQKSNYDPLDIGGTILIPITRALSFSFDRNVNGTFNVASERVIESTGTVFPTDARDVVLVERLDYQYKQFVFEGGLSFRHRMDGTGVSGASYPYTISSTEWHYGYLGATYLSPPVRAILGSRFVFGITGEDQPVDKHVAVLNPVTKLVSYIDEHPNQNQYYEMTESAGIIIPVDAEHGISATAKFNLGAGAYYENSPFPYRYSTVVLGATKRFSNLFSLTVRATNVHGMEQGYPYPVPSVIHNEVLDVLADFHIDTNHLFGRR